MRAGPWLRPYSHYMRRLVSRRRTLYDVASDIITFCPEEKTPGKPAIYLPDQLDRVTAVQEETSLDIEKARIEGHERVHRASRAFVLRDVVLRSGSLYTSGYRHLLLHGNQSHSNMNDRPASFKRASLAITYMGLKYFGHWLRDDRPLALLAMEQGEAVSLPLPEWPDTQAYDQWFDTKTNIVNEAYFDELLVFDDVAQNSLKRTRYDALRARLRQYITPKRSGHSVYLRRGRNGVCRHVANEGEIIDTLARHGFHILEPDNMSLSELLEELMDAKIVVSVEGSHMNHCLYTMALGGALIALQPSNRFNNNPRGWTECLGMDYGFVVGETANGATIYKKSDILKTVEMVEDQL